MGTRLVKGAFWLATSLLLACAADTDGTESEPGSVSAQLTVDEDMSVQSIVYVLGGGPLGSPVQGAFEPTGGPPFQWAISNLPAAEGYTLSISGYDEEGNELCAGNTHFDVLENDSTFLNIRLVCGLDPSAPSGRAEVRATLKLVQTMPCPLVHSVNFVPARIGPGRSAQLEVVATDPGASPLAYAWTASAGSFDDASSSSPSYSCNGVTGPQALSVTLDNGEPACRTSAEVTLDCAP